MFSTYVEVNFIELLIKKILTVPSTVTVIETDFKHDTDGGITENITPFHQFSFLIESISTNVFLVDSLKSYIFFFIFKR